MAEEKNREHTEFHLEKLGIRQIQERIEVSPILTDPGTMGLDAEDNTPKSYVCTINFKDQPDNPKVIMLHREFMVADHPLRQRARDFLLEWAIEKGERPWLLRLFKAGDVEDRFLAIRALGRIHAPETMALVWRLLEDQSWKPRANSVVNCGELALATHSFEGGEAARFLILLQRDARFQRFDKRAVRHATRVWKYGELGRYIDIGELSHPDGERREKMARFAGAAGFEAARAPLIGLARDKHERVPVREAATEALGGLTIARADLAAELSRLLTDSEPKVRQAAVRGHRWSFRRRWRHWRVDAALLRPRSAR